MPEEINPTPAKYARSQYETPVTHVADGPASRREPKSQLVRDATDTTQTSDPNSHAKKLDKRRRDREAAQQQPAQRETAEAGPEEVAADTTKPKPRSTVKQISSKKGDKK